MKTAFVAAELGNDTYIDIDIDLVVMTVLNDGDTTVSAEVQKAKDALRNKQEQTVWDTTGNKQSHFVKAEQLAFCPVKVQVPGAAEDERVSLSPTHPLAAAIQPPTLYPSPS